MQQIPLQATPNQALRFYAGDVACQVTLFQKRCGLFLDVYVEDEPVALGILCVNMRTLVRAPAFPGELVFRDTKGAADPFWQGLNDRFHLLHLTQEDLVLAGS